jgi:hypothetical protein
MSVASFNRTLRAIGVRTESIEVAAAWQRNAAKTRKMRAVWPDVGPEKGKLSRCSGELVQKRQEIAQVTGRELPGITPGKGRAKGRT